MAQRNFIRRMSRRLSGVSRSSVQSADTVQASAPMLVSFSSNNNADTSLLMPGPVDVLARSDTAMHEHTMLSPTETIAVPHAPATTPLVGSSALSDTHGAGNDATAESIRDSLSRVRMNAEIALRACESTAVSQHTDVDGLMDVGSSDNRPATPFSAQLDASDRIDALRSLISSIDELMRGDERLLASRPTSTADVAKALASLKGSTSGGEEVGRDDSASVASTDEMWDKTDRVMKYILNTTLSARKLSPATSASISVTIVDDESFSSNAADLPSPKKSGKHGKSKLGGATDGHAVESSVQVPVNYQLEMINLVQSIERAMRLAPRLHSQRFEMPPTPKELKEARKQAAQRIHDRGALPVKEIDDILDRLEKTTRPELGHQRSALTPTDVRDRNVRNAEAERIMDLIGNTCNPKLTDQRSPTALEINNRRRESHLETIASVVNRTVYKNQLSDGREELLSRRMEREAEKIVSMVVPREGYSSQRVEPSPP